MKFYSLTCTRDKELSPTTQRLIDYYNRAGVESHILYNKSSIFEAYSEGIEALNADLDDIIILCHDDIHILTDPKVFTSLLEITLNKHNAGFAGIAGASVFTEKAVWWDQECWTQGLLTGQAFHGTLQKFDHAIYGPYREAVVMDGVFLAAKLKTLRNIGLKKPAEFSGDWDFYDILYTFKAFLKKYKNYTVPIQVIHESRGELVGRDSWHNNKKAFIDRFAQYLPAKIRSV